MNDNNGAVRILMSTDGTTALGTGNPFARLHVETASSGVARNVALSNGSGVSGSGAQIEFDDQNAQYATIAATFDVNAQPRTASLKFSVRSADVMTERLKLNGTGIGFFGARPVAQPVVAGSRGGNAALGNLLAALSRLGLISDSSTN